MKLIKILLLFPFIITVACSTLTLKPTNFAWPVEEVLKINDDGRVTEDRYAIEFNTKGIFHEEFNDSSAYKNKELRILRNMNGCYFITSEQFKNVYVFKADDGALVLENKIQVSETGLKNPALNQREPYVELIDGTEKLLLTNDGIYRTEK
jgi:hypothetical protein